MATDDLHGRRLHLYDRLVAGEIDKARHEHLIAELRTLESSRASDAGVRLLVFGGIAAFCVLAGLVVGGILLLRGAPSDTAAGGSPPVPVATNSAAPPQRATAPNSSATPPSLPPVASTAPATSTGESATPAAEPTKQPAAIVAVPSEAK